MRAGQRASGVAAIEFAATGDSARAWPADYEVHSQRFRIARPTGDAAGTLKGFTNVFAAP